MTESTHPKPAIVLVHGAFADASGWTSVLLSLMEKGYPVTGVQIALKSLADDVATTVRALQAEKGNIVLVGHSYGGAVITGAAAMSPQVKALVYVSAFAPDSGEALGPLIESYPPSQLPPALVPDAAGFLYIDRNRFREVFAGDVAEDVRAVMAVTQKPIAAAIFGEPTVSAAWKTIPSWYIVSSEDCAINPDLERFMAGRMKAQTTELTASHCAFISQPAEVVRVIESAAATA